MSHFDMWLKRYNLRRNQIIDDLSLLAEQVSSVKESIDIKGLFQPISEPMIHPVKMAFVDGGQGIRDLMGLAVYFIRSCAFIMGEIDGQGQKEMFIRNLDINISSHDTHTTERIEVLRDKMEFDTALRCVIEHEPDILVLDGSLFVKACKKFPCREYSGYKTSLEALMDACAERNTVLMGVSEDSKSRLFTRHIAKTQNIKFPDYMTDPTIIRLLTPFPNFKTRPFMPESSKGDPTFPTAYMQTTPFSNPLRIDFMGSIDELGKYLDLIGDLCKGSGQYGYPLPLYYAHIDAHIPSTQMDWTVRQIVNYVSRKDKSLVDAIFGMPRRMSRPA